MIILFRQIPDLFVFLSQLLGLDFEFGLELSDLSLIFTRFGRLFLFRIHLLRKLGVIVVGLIKLSYESLDLKLYFADSILEHGILLVSILDFSMQIIVRCSQLCNLVLLSL